MSKVFRNLWSAALAIVIAGGVSVSAASATDCGSDTCFSSLQQRLQAIRAERGTLDPVVETETLDGEFVNRISFFVNRRDFTATGVKTVVRTRFNSFIDRDFSVMPSLTETSPRLTGLFGRLDRNRFNPQVFIETPEQSIYTAESILEGPDYKVASVPLPASLPLILAGLGSFAVLRRRKRNI
ncbi:VPLPA-CTERM sorting domain-containing protein [Ovoidimarina sediminis]|uniref:VPLPA-CTERM sorting domain-containing protein n=1 Tax=Ovoidimarina sediminis TaxID=3079856 RepID=UPI0029134B59|nr:VPLPA-CTERM sorting domain-containing protein [Rhodophyticola sp. MJ-SS7]MDU8944894.1 VPLPA-CTERM sorting domain-containing protein [Rhodophyticola sp. MJ-SS7]